MRLIDADALKKKAWKADTRYGLVRVVDAVEIDYAPTIDAVPAKYGEWIGTEYDGDADGYPVYTEYKCSECGTIWEDEDSPLYWHYCPICGAKMKGAEE